MLMCVNIVGAKRLRLLKSLAIIVKNWFKEIGISDKGKSF